MITTAPETNAEGYQAAFEQLRGFGESGQYPIGSSSGYDRKSDTLWIRFGFSRPSVTYYCPENPLFLFMLDRVTGELTGIELTHFRSVLVKQKPELKCMLPKTGFLPFFSRQKSRTIGGPTERIARILTGPF